MAALKKAAGQSFAFFPPIRGLEANVWRFGEATRIEFSATNTATGEVIWFPRSNVSYVTIEEEGLTIALKREMRYSGGAVWAARDAEQADTARPQEAEDREMPEAFEEEAAGEAQPAGAGARPAARRKQQKGLFSEPLTLVLVTAGAAAFVLIMALVVARAWLQPSPSADNAPIADSNLYTLTSDDNYADIVRKVGSPERERELSSAGNQLQQRALLYPSRNYAVIVLGVQGSSSYSQEPRYIGAIRLSDGAVVASVNYSHDTNSEALLKMAARQLKGER